MDEKIFWRITVLLFFFHICLHRRNRYFTWARLCRSLDDLRKNHIYVEQYFFSQNFLYPRLSWRGSSRGSSRSPLPLAWTGPSRIPPLPRTTTRCPGGKRAGRTDLQLFYHLKNPFRSSNSKFISISPTHVLKKKECYFLLLLFLKHLPGVLQGLWYWLASCIGLQTQMRRVWK